MPVLRDLRNAIDEALDQRSDTENQESPLARLSRAALDNDRRTFEALLTRADALALGPGNMSPVAVSVAMNHTDILDVSIEAGIDLDQQLKMNLRESVFDTAAVFASERTMEALLQGTSIAFRSSAQERYNALSNLMGRTAKAKNAEAYRALVDVFAQNRHALTETNRRLLVRYTLTTASAEHWVAGVNAVLSVVNQRYPDLGADILNVADAVMDDQKRLYLDAVHTRAANGLPDGADDAAQILEACARTMFPPADLKATGRLRNHLSEAILDDNERILDILVKAGGDPSYLTDGGRSLIETALVSASWRCLNYMVVECGLDPFDFRFVTDMTGDEAGPIELVQSSTTAISAKDQNQTLELLARLQEQHASSPSADRQASKHREHRLETGGPRPF